MTDRWAGHSMSRPWIVFARLARPFSPFEQAKQRSSRIEPWSHQFVALVVDLTCRLQQCHRSVSIDHPFCV